MFFDRRRKFNGNVAALLPAFDVDLKEAGVMKVLGVLDVAWADKYSTYEAALVLAYGFVFGLYEKNDHQRANQIAQDRIKPIQSDWIKKGIVRPHIVALFAKRLEERMSAARGVQTCSKGRLPS